MWKNGKLGVLEKGLSGKVQDQGGWKCRFFEDLLKTPFKNIQGTWRIPNSAFAFCPE